MYRPWCLLYLAFCFSLAVYGSAAQTPNRDVLQINAPHSGVFKMVYVAIGDIVRGG